MEKVISKDGTPIAYEKSGHGPALVLVHGTSADHGRWAVILPQLQERYTVYAMDRRGRGGSGDNPPYAIEREFEDVAAVVDSIPSPVVLLGHSYGAICSLEGARLTHNLNRLILYEPPILTGAGEAYPRQSVDKITRLDEQGNWAGVVETFLREVPRVSDQDMQLLKSSPSWAARVAAGHTIVRELRESNLNGYHFEAAKFAGFSIPTLLLLGGDSPHFFGAAIDLLHGVLPHNHLVVLPGQQHVAINSSPELFLKEVFGFLDGHAH